MSSLIDMPARLRALTELKSTLLVEAAAGTGKTEIIAGRVTLLLADGVAPAHIAAITFTELAASALTARIHSFVEDLSNGRVPKSLRQALPEGLDGARATALAAAAAKLDEITTSTIHGFCQLLIHAHAVEADIDPGAQVMDASQADAAFTMIFEKWLKRRLTSSSGSGDPIAALSLEDPRNVAETLQDLAQFKQRHRSARVLAADFATRPDTQFVASVEAFRSWLANAPPENTTAELVSQLETLARFYDNCLSPIPDFPGLWRLAHPEPLPCMRGKTFDLTIPRVKGAWARVAGASEAERLASEADQLFERVHGNYRALRGVITTALTQVLSAELDEVLKEYELFKRDAAVLDFDDLLHRARSLVSQHDRVRCAIGERFTHVLVDEFQDTDPIQAEILFRIASEKLTTRWQDSPLRPGALFLVGDPKQAIYSFRGADVGTYLQARDAISSLWPTNIVQITANFRSVSTILNHVNRCFESVLNAPEQPGYVPLAGTIDALTSEIPCVAKLTIELPPSTKSDASRDAEASALAEVCARLIGNIKVRGNDGTAVTLSPGGIALLTPTGTDLWRYERALERLGLPIASQAGKGLFRRQEIQDLLTIARVLADARDTLAFGALMRGPLVGLTDEELLDITLRLSPTDDPSPRFSVATDPELVTHPLAREVLTTLRELRRRANSTTPQLLLAEAVEHLGIRAHLALRDDDRNSRAIANVEMFIEQAGAYGVTGLKRFVRDMHSQWQKRKSSVEGRVDAEGDAIELVTIHSSKGLEWPVVLLANMGTVVWKPGEFVHRPADDTLHWVLGDVVPPSLRPALEADDRNSARERERLWYVACTRARDLLIVPNVTISDQRSWAKVIDEPHRSLPEFDISSWSPAPLHAPAEELNAQTARTFATEREIIVQSTHAVEWFNPSHRDVDQLSYEGPKIVDNAIEVPEAATAVGAGRLRGLLLHKVIEEVLTGELSDTATEIAARARELMKQLSRDDRNLPSAEEIAETVTRTLSHPQLANLRSKLVPELPVYGVLRTEPDVLALAGRVDAAVVEDGLASVVVDWKSDVAPDAADIQVHADQLRDYLLAISAPRGALVYMSTGAVHWVDAAVPTVAATTG